MNQMNQEFLQRLEKDEIKAFEYYKQSIENGNLNAKFYLGYCYVNGIGTKVDKEKGLELYDEAANKENWIAHGEDTGRSEMICMKFTARKLPVDLFILSAIKKFLLNLIYKLKW